MRAAFLLHLLLLVGCVSHGAALESRCKSQRVVLAVYVEPSLSEVDRLRRSIKGLSHADVKGFYKGFMWQEPDGSYSIVVPAPRGQDDKEYWAIWGHELGHVICGDWHEKQQR